MDIMESRRKGRDIIELSCLFTNCQQRSSKSLVERNLITELSWTVRRLVSSSARKSSASLLM